jgi:hypothetical protein
MQTDVLNHIKQALNIPAEDTVDIYNTDNQLVVNLPSILSSTAANHQVYKV